METLLQIIFACPKCWRVVAGGLGTLCTTWFFVSLTVGRKFDRLEARSGVNLPSQLLDSLPFATTGQGLALLAVVALICWCVVGVMRQIERSY